MKPMKQMVEQNTTLYAATLEFQSAYLQAVIDECRGSITDAARKLGIHRNSLHRHIAECSLLSWVESSRQMWRRERRERRHEVTRALKDSKYITPRQLLAETAVLSLPNLINTDTKEIRNV